MDFTPKRLGQVASDSNGGLRYVEKKLILRLLTNIANQYMHIKLINLPYKANTVQIT